MEDVAPTLLDLMGIAPLPEATGRSLAGFLTGKAEGAPETPVLLNHQKWMALRGPNWKILADARGHAPRMFELDQDPRELHPITGTKVVANHMHGLEQRMKRDSDIRAGMEWGVPTEAGIDEGTRERLRELGYIQ